MTMKRILSTISLAVAVMVMAQIAAQAQTACRNYKAAFSIENTTGVTIPYQISWGNKSDWKSAWVSNGTIKTHSIGLNNDNTARTPFIRFDVFTGDGNRSTPKPFRLKLNYVGCAGYLPKSYEFRFSGRYLDIYEK
jgi:hypothetical protein